jgi:uncharacterized membrane protein
MSLIEYNFNWMTFNIFLAIVPVFTGWLLYLAKRRIVQMLYGLIWFVFLPNSIYLFTDLINLINQWNKVGGPERLVFLFQYGILVFFGFITYILALYPFELFLSRFKFHKDSINSTNIIIIINFIIGFGITLGRVERLNSWDLISAPMNVVKSSINIITSYELLILTILFGLFGNFLYFLFKKPLVKLISIYLSQFGASA